MKTNRLKHLKVYGIGILAALVYLVTAINSTGYHHPDEHFQIIEFAGLKAGWNTGSNLTWEYDSQIRPALQPVLALSCFRILDLLSIHSPYAKMLFLRLLTAILALIAISWFVRSFWHTVKPAYQTAFLCLSLFLWFLPAVNVRFSSETWSGLFFLIALAWIHRGNNISLYTSLGIGFLLGVGFELRFQLALCIAGLLLWLLFIGKWELRRILCLIAGCCGAVIFATLIDCWFYGEFVCAPYNYFRSNIVDGVASFFGTSPWYYYLMRVMESATSLFGLAIWLSVIALLLFAPRNILLWCLIPFLAVHFFIPHKELRFLFPVINLVPLLLVWFFQLLMDRLNYQILKKAVLYPVIGVMFFVNMVGLTMLMFKPAGNGSVEIAEYIQRNYGNHSVTVYSYKGYSPYSVGSAKGLTSRFYLNDQIHFQDFIETKTGNWQKRPQKIRDCDLIVIPANDNFGRFLAESWGFEKKKRSIPAWIGMINRFYRVYNDGVTLELYEKKKKARL